VNAQTGKQFVLNTATGAWCRWGINSGCATIWQSRLISGYTTGVYELEGASAPGKDDTDGATMAAYFKQAYSTLGLPGRKKLIRRMTPRFGDGDENIGYFMSMDPDYQDVSYSASALRSTEWWGDRASAADFGVALVNPIEAHGAIGTAFSLRVMFSQSGSQSGQEDWIYAGADVHYEAGF
jgi:hypothetical protein